MGDYNLDFWKRFEKTTRRVERKKACKRLKVHNRVCSTKGYSFGSSKRLEHGSTSITLDAAFIPKNERKIRSVGGAFSMARRTLDKVSAEKPNASFQPQVSAFGFQGESRKRNAPSFGFGSTSKKSLKAERESAISCLQTGQEYFTTRPRVVSFSFGIAPRKSDLSAHLCEVPGPGSYAFASYDRAFMPNKGAVIGPKDGTSSALLFAKQKTMHKPKLSHKMKFGFGCSVKEHLQFGTCRDGRCNQRGSWEGPVKSEPNSFVVLDGFQITSDPHYFLEILTQIDLNEKDELGRNCLHQIALEKFGNEEKSLHKAELVRIAAEESAQLIDVDETDDAGCTALHHAISCNKLKLVEFLLEHFADPHIVNLEGKSPLHLGKLPSTKHEIFQVIENYAQKNIMIP